MTKVARAQSGTGMFNRLTARGDALNIKGREHVTFAKSLHPVGFDQHV